MGLTTRGMTPFPQRQTNKGTLFLRISCQRHVWTFWGLFREIGQKHTKQAHLQGPRHAATESGSTLRPWGTKAASTHHQDKTQTKRHPVSWNTTPLDSRHWEPVNTLIHTNTKSVRRRPLRKPLTVWCMRPCGCWRHRLCLRVFPHMGLSLWGSAAKSGCVCLWVCVSGSKREGWEGEQMIE